MTAAWVMFALLAATLLIVVPLSVRTHPQSLVPKFAARWGRG